MNRIDSPLREIEILDLASASQLAIFPFGNPPQERVLIGFGIQRRKQLDETGTQFSRERGNTGELTIFTLDLQCRACAYLGRRV